MMFSRGFGDGAKFSAIKYTDDSDYMLGWARGREASESAFQEFLHENQLEPPLPIRAAV